MSIRMGKNLKQKFIDFFVSYTSEGTKILFDVETQPKPTFFSNTQIEQMKHEPGSYQYGEGVRK